MLKPKQLETLKYIFQGKDVFVWIPTSYGVIKPYTSCSIVNWGGALAGQ